jgi:uncharacterized protein (TIGR02284 family)
MSDKNIGTLNSLIATTLDSVDGYRKAADEANGERFKDVFLSRANERQAIVTTFQAKVRELGGNPEDDGTVLASAHRAFLGLRDALTGDRDDRAVRQLVQTAFTSVREGNDQMSALKHQLSAS